MKFSFTLLDPHLKFHKILKNYFFILITSISVFSFPSYSESFTAKRAGQGFTGLTQDYASALSNPALISKHNTSDGLYFSLNLALLTSDEFDVIDTAENIANDLENLSDEINDETTNQQSEVLNQQVNNIIDNLNPIDKKIVNIRSGLNFQMYIPNKHVNLGFSSYL